MLTTNPPRCRGRKRSRTARPGESREEIELVNIGLVCRVVLALEEHLGDAGAVAEISIDLEGTALVEEISEGSLGQLEGKLAIGHLAVVRPGPERDSPGVGPAGAPIAAPFHEDLSGVKKLWIFRREFGAGVEAPQRGHVAMIVVGFVDVILPFLKLAVFADLVWGQLTARGGELVRGSPGRC